MNFAYVRALPPETFTEYAAPYYEQAGIGSMDREILCRILQPRVEIFSQIPEMVGFLAELPEYGVELYTNKKSKTDAAVSAEVLDTVIPALEGIGDWTEENLHDTLIGIAEAKGMKNGTVLWPVRIAMAGRQVTPGGAIEIGMLLRKEETLRRLRLGRQKLADAQQK